MTTTLIQTQQIKYIKHKMMTTLTQYPSASVHVEVCLENGQPILWVFLDGCYVGDIVISDEPSGEVFDLWSGEIV